MSGDVTVAIAVAVGRKGISRLEKLNEGQRDRVEHKHGTHDAADGPSFIHRRYAPVLRKRLMALPVLGNARPSAGSGVRRGALTVHCAREQGDLYLGIT